MGFFNDFIRGATPAIEGGTNIGLRGMAEAQRKKELQDEIQRQTGQQAFMNMMAQQNYAMDERQQGFNETKWQEEAPARTADLGYKAAATNKMTAEYDPNNPITSVDIGYKKAQTHRLMNPVDTNTTAAESWDRGLSKLEPDEQSDAYRIKYGLKPKASKSNEITEDDVYKVYTKMLSDWTEVGQYDGVPKPTPQEAYQIAKEIKGVMNPQQQPQSNQNRVPMGNQGGPVNMSGGQPQGMDRATLLKQRFDADPTSLTQEEFDELGMYLNGGK